jgi:hypothetical protein
VSADGQQACPAAGLGAGGNTAKVKRDDVDIGDHQVPAGSQDAGELGHHRAERAHMNERQGADDQIRDFIRDRQLVSSPTAKPACGTRRRALASIRASTNSRSKPSPACARSATPSSSSKNASGCR